MSSIYHIPPFMLVYLPATSLSYTLLERRIEWFTGISVVLVPTKCQRYLYVQSPLFSKWIYIHHYLSFQGHFP